MGRSSQHRAVWTRCGGQNRRCHLIWSNVVPAFFLVKLFSRLHFPFSHFLDIFPSSVIVSLRYLTVSSWQYLHFLNRNFNFWFHSSFWPFWQDLFPCWPVCLRTKVNSKPNLRINEHQTRYSSLLTFLSWSKFYDRHCSCLRLKISQ